MNEAKLKLIDAEKKASLLFKQIGTRGLICPGKSENELNTEIFNLAYEMYGVKKYWHKRIVRAGKNTLKPYNENPDNLILKEDDILFIDFGPIFDEWEADYGRTYVLGGDKSKIKLMNNLSSAWEDCKNYFVSKKKISGAELYEFAFNQAKVYGWKFGGEIAGHLIGYFPHEKLDQEDKTNYIHPDNNIDMHALDINGDNRNWILEIHFIDEEKEIGGFFEQLLTT